MRRWRCSAHVWVAGRLQDGNEKAHAKALPVGRPGALGRLAHVPLEVKHNEAYKDTTCPLTFALVRMNSHWTILACGGSSSGALALLLPLIAAWVTAGILAVVNLVLIMRVPVGAGTRYRQLLVLGFAIAVTALLFTGTLGELPRLMLAAVFGVPLLVFCQFGYLMILRAGIRPRFPKPIPVPDESYRGPRCVSCRAPLDLGARVCPVCGWTQPGYETAS